MTLSCAQRLKQAGLSLRDGEELLLLHMAEVVQHVTRMNPGRGVSGSWNRESPSTAPAAHPQKDGRIKCSCSDALSLKLEISDVSHFTFSVINMGVDLV